MLKIKKLLPIFLMLMFLPLVSPVLANAPVSVKAGINKDKGFVHDPTVPIDGVDYYLAGAPDADNGATDIPGHYWVLAGKNRLIGKHYNVGPFGMPQW
ncbi:MAG: hypothetical protein ACTSR2_10745 [Candidatus Hodarchaeales archaeon]